MCRRGPDGTIIEYVAPDGRVAPAILHFDSSGGRKEKDGGPKFLVSRATRLRRQVAERSRVRGAINGILLSPFLLPIGGAPFHIIGFRDKESDLLFFAPLDRVASN